MGMRFFEESGMFYPKDYGLQAGDMIDLVLVGGGGGGGTGTVATSGIGGNGGGSGFVVFKNHKLTQADEDKGVAVTIGAGGESDGAGGATAFGSIATADGASGQEGLFPGGNASIHAGGGAGGYIPGVKDWGGKGGTGSPGGTSQEIWVIGTAGIGAGYPFEATIKYLSRWFSGMYTDGMYRGAKKGMIATSSYNKVGSGGSGYGAGGGGGAGCNTSANSAPGNGGRGANGYCGIYW